SRPKEPIAPAAREAVPAEPTRPVEKPEPAQPKVGEPAPKPATDGKVVPIKPRREEPAPAPSERVVAPAAAVEKPSAPRETPAPTGVEKPATAPAPAVVETGPRTVLKLPESVTVSELAERMGRKIGEVIRELVGMGVMATINQPLDADKVKAVAARFGFDADMRSAEERDLFEEEP